MRAASRVSATAARVDRQQVSAGRATKTLRRSWRCSTSRLHEPMHATPVPAFSPRRHRWAQARPTLFLFGTPADQRHRARSRSAILDEALAACSAERARPGQAAPASRPRARAPSTSSGRGGCSTQGAVVLLLTDGLERDPDDRLGFEIDRLHPSCRRLHPAQPAAAVFRLRGQAPRHPRPCCRMWTNCARSTVWSMDRPGAGTVRAGRSETDPSRQRLAKAWRI